ncbi:MAG: helix-turn-helix domain-containing protein [Alphaproteobacteria bacterium]
MKKEFYEVLVCSADQAIAKALGSIVRAINGQPILLKDYSEIKNINLKNINAIIVNDTVLFKDKKVHIKTVYNKFKTKIPIFCLVENIYEEHSSDSLLHFYKKPIDKVTLKNALEPYFYSANDQKQSPLIKMGKFNFNKKLNTLTGNNKEIISLTNLEAKLLLILFKNIDKTLEEEFLLKQVWGYSLNANSNTIKTHIWRLRKKLSNIDDTMFSLETSKKGYVLKKFVS